MKRIIFSLSLLVAFFIGNAQTNQTFTFDELTLPDTGFWNGVDTSVYSGSFGDAVISFNNFVGDYNWAGFAFSNWTDTLGATYNNQWSSYAGEAASDSIFCVGYIDTYNNVSPLISFSHKVKIQSLKITNNTYTAQVIKNGNAYSRKFSTDSADYYKILVYAINGTDTIDTVEVYLADYRTLDSVVVKDWKDVDLSSFDSITAIGFGAITTDMGVYGANTPLYFCVDDITYRDGIISKINSINDRIVSVYPNPATDYISINCDVSEVYIFDMMGKLVKQSNNGFVDVSSFKSGSYMIKINTGKEYKVSKFIKL